MKGVLRIRGDRLVLDLCVVIATQWPAAPVSAQICLEKTLLDSGGDRGNWDYFSMFIFGMLQEVLGCYGSYTQVKV